MTTLVRQAGSIARLSRPNTNTLRCTSRPQLPRNLRQSRLVASQSRQFATANPVDPKNSKNDKKSRSTQGNNQGSPKSKKPGKPAPGFESLYNNSSPLSKATLAVKPSQEPAPERPKLYHSSDFLSQSSSKESAHSSKSSTHPDKSNLAQLSDDEKGSLDNLLTTIKKGLPTSQVTNVEAAFEDIKRNGIPVEVREIMDKLKGGATLDLATAAKLVRLTNKMARHQAEKIVREETKNEDRKSESSSSKQQGEKKKSGPEGGFKVPEFKMDTGTFLVSAFTAYLIYRIVVPTENSKELTWQEFNTTFLSKGLVEKLTVFNESRVRVDVNRESVAQMYPDSPAAHNNFHYYFSIGSVEGFERKLEESQSELGIPSSERIPVAYARAVPFFEMLINFGPTLLFIGGLFYLSRRAQGGSGGGSSSGIFGMGRSRAKKFNHETDIKTKFKDVAGMDEAKLEIMEFVSFLKSPDQYQRLGAKIPRGAILSGPPGTGKTLLAKATAGESQVPFFSVSGSEFVEMFVGVGASRVRDLFANARKSTPCIVFIDEIDAIGKSRSKQGWGGGNDEREATLNQILTEMDGFNTSEQVVVLAGTNRPDVLDPALMRPGRFDRHIAIDRPTIDGRKQIFLVHLGKVVTDENMDHLTGRLAALTPGFSGADIANCVNEAALIGKSPSFNLSLRPQAILTSHHSCPNLR